jgi:spore cortex formation protein SpoVR/YcgB (stage V sporulation)
MQKEELWKLLVDTVHAIPMYKARKRYVEEVMLKEKPELSSQELAVQINVTLGEATVMLDEIRSSMPQEAAKQSQTPSKPSDRTLFDFSK